MSGPMKNSKSPNPQCGHMFKSEASVSGIFEGDHNLLVVINAHFKMFVSIAKTCHARSFLVFGGFYISPP